MRLGPKYKICRRLGNGVFDKCQTQRFTISEARHSKTKSKSRAKAVSDYGKQMLEKQKVRFAYGLGERQMRRYIAQASSITVAGDPIEKLIRGLETRLDNVVYRAGLANSRPLARQMVSHGHIMVNGRRMTIPSYQVKPGDTFGVREASKQKPLITKRKEEIATVTCPAWITFDSATYEGSLRALPSKESAEPVADLSSVLEFYSR